VVARAAAAGIELLALSDHDTVDGVDEALAAALEHGLELVPAVELSSIEGEHEDYHVLGYRIDHRDAGLARALEAFREDRAARAGRMARALRELGFVLDDAPLERRRAAAKPIGRPHLAQAVFDHPDNRDRLRAEGIDATPSDVLVAYLTPGAPAYRGRTMPSVPAAIEVIHAAGGVAVWAHPFWDVEEPASVLATIDRLHGAGLDGVECFYPTFSETQTHLLHDACERRGMLSTGSADFHGPEHPHFASFGTFELYGLRPRLGPIAA
jgi:predicted metal-dependent phosphoesterase TrpH